MARITATVAEIIDRLSPSGSNAEKGSLTINPQSTIPPAVPSLPQSLSEIVALKEDDLAILRYIIDQQIICTTRQIADHFGITSRQTLRRIDNLKGVGFLNNDVTGGHLASTKGMAFLHRRSNGERDQPQ